LDEGLSIVPQCGNHPQWPGQLHDVPGVPCHHYRPKPEPPQGPGVRMIALTNGGYAYVDAADFEWLNKYHWRLENGYAARYEKGKVVFMHRQILKPPKSKLVDHSDGNQINNCRTNIRPATRTQNRGNQRKCYHTASRFKGTYYNRDVRKWYAHCMYAGENHCSAYFDTDEEAARAYDALAVAWFGEFARLNFPREWPPERRAQVYAANAKQREKADRTKGNRKRARARREKAKGKKKSGNSRREKAQGNKGQSGRTKATVERKKAKSKVRKPRRGE
jgi:hypothetical protein